MVTTSEAGKKIAKSSTTAFHKAINKRPTRLKLQNVTEATYTFLFNGNGQDILKKYVQLEQAFVETPTKLKSNMLINTIWKMDDGTEETTQYRYVQDYYDDGTSYDMLMPLYKRYSRDGADNVPEDEKLTEKSTDIIEYPDPGDVPNDDWYWPVYEELLVGDKVEVYFAHDYRGEVLPEFRAKGWEKVEIMESVDYEDNSHKFRAEYITPKRKIEEGDDADTINDKKADNQVVVDVWYRPVRRLEDSDSGEDSDKSVDANDLVSDPEDDEVHTEGEDIQYKGNTYVLSFEKDDKGDRIYKLKEKEGDGVERLTSEQLDNRFIPELSIGNRILHNDTVKEIVGINYTHKKYVVREIDDSGFVLSDSSDDASDYLLCDDEMVSAQDIKELRTVISLFRRGDKVLYNWHICQIAIVNENGKYTLIDLKTREELPDVSESDITDNDFVLKKDDSTVWKFVKTKDKKNGKGKEVPHVYLQNERENSKGKRGKKKSFMVSTYQNNFIADQREIGDFLKGKDRRDGPSGHDSDLAYLVYKKGDKVLYAPEGVKEVKATVKYVEEDTIQIQIDGASETINVRDDQLRLYRGEEEEVILEVGDYVFEKGTLWQIATREGDTFIWKEIEKAVHGDVLAYKGDDRKNRVEYKFDDDSGKWVERNPEDDSEDEDSEGDAPVEAEYREGEYVEIDGGNISKIEKVNRTKYKLEGMEDWVDEDRILNRYIPEFGLRDPVFTVSACELREIKSVNGDGTYTLNGDERVPEKDLRAAIELVKSGSLVRVSGEKHQYFIVLEVDGCNYHLKNIYSNEESLVDVEKVDEFEASGFELGCVVKYKVGDVEKYGEVIEFDKKSCLYTVKDCNGSPFSHIRENGLEAAEPMLSEDVKVHVKSALVFSITGVVQKKRTYTLKSEEVSESEVSEVGFGDGEGDEEEAGEDPLLEKGTSVTLRLENPTFVIKAKNELKRTYKVGGVFSANVVDKVK